jgi:hypothetical protein
MRPFQSGRKTKRKKRKVEAKGDGGWDTNQNLMRNPVKPWLAASRTSKEKTSAWP